MFASSIMFKFHLENGYGAMLMRERFGGELWCTLNLAVREMGGVPMSFLGHKGWGYGRILGGFGGSFQVILDLR
jgi:hypothetical protein